MARQPSEESKSGLEATAVVTGSVLSGAMMSLSLMAVPVFLDTTTDSALLTRQWVRMYHYGHQVLPTMAVVTFSLYGYSVFRRRAAQRSWGRTLLAGITTVAMLPFTWLVMVPTNDTLFALEVASRAAPAATLEEVKALVVKWSWMHMTRSFFPLIGAVLGTMQVLGS